MALDKLVDSTQLNLDLTSVANAIRAKSGGSSTLAFPVEFVSEIGNIPTGGGGITEKDVNFYDYDGTLVASKTKTEINAMTSDADLPANPTHEGLTAQGWNWTVAQLKSQLTAMPDQPVNVGQLYVTTNGKTEIDVEFADSILLSPKLTFSVNGTVSVDWGDNTTPDTVTGTSLTARQTIGPHNYAATGSYTISITVVSGSFTFYGDTADAKYGILRKYDTGGQNIVYTNCIKNVRLGTGISQIKQAAFNYCYSLESITIPSTVTSIDQYAFNQCRALKSITIPRGVTSIGIYLFNICTSLVNIAIPSTVTSVGHDAFNCAFRLTSITFPSGITSIGDNAFYDCYSLSSIIIPSGVTSIGTWAFGYCESLASITIPNTVTSIGNYAFYHCSAIKNIIMPSSASIGTYAFQTCTCLSSITLPSTITSISSGILYQCYSLTSISIPSGVTSIGDSSFRACDSLASITIPNTVTSIGNYAFCDCYGIKEYHILPTTVPTLGTYAFRNIISDCIIYVPRSENQTVLNAYKTASNWSAYASYMQEEPAS